jgi:hypothetical protein
LRAAHGGSPSSPHYQRNDADGQRKHRDEHSPIVIVHAVTHGRYTQ